jgi:O-antigen biosynthesis protein WbqV
MKIYALFTLARRLSIDVLLCLAAFAAVGIVPVVQTIGLAPLEKMTGPLRDLAIFTALSIPILALMRTYRIIWRYVSFQDVMRLMAAATILVIAFLVVEFGLIHPGAAIPISIVLWSGTLIWAATLAFLTAPRFVARALNDRKRNRGGGRSPISKNYTPILLTGDPQRMDCFIRDCFRDHDTAFRVVGVFTEDTRLHGGNLNGIEVLGSDSALRSSMAQLRLRGIVPESLVLANDNAQQTDVERLLDLTTGLDIKLGRLPKLGTFEGASSIKPIAIADLLGRPEIVIDDDTVAAMISNKTVLVTGAGGSIGSELCRQIAAMKPSKLVITDASEFNLYSIDMEIAETFPRLARESLLLDVRDAALVSRLFRSRHPSVVFHAAALKHVPLLEDNPIEAIKTNILGTINIAEACRANGVAAMVTISTDKAVNPCNVMGATKRLAEAYCQGVDQDSVSIGTTRFITVRFGNVLGSAGSVVPLFQRQIRTGGPVTVTHPEITRFFMTIPEAVTLVLQAGAHGIALDDERGSIYVLDMGKPVKIVDLARQMIRLSGMRPDVDVGIEIIGLRPGEKLYEEVVHSEEALGQTSHKSVFRVTPRATDIRIIQQQVQEIIAACTTGDDARALRVLKISVPEFLPDETLRVASS